MCSGCGYYSKQSVDMVIIVNGVWVCAVVVVSVDVVIIVNRV